MCPGCFSQKTGCSLRTKPDKGLRHLGVIAGACDLDWTPPGNGPGMLHVTQVCSRGSLERLDRAGGQVGGRCLSRRVSVGADL